MKHSPSTRARLGGAGRAVVVAGSAAALAVAGVAVATADDVDDHIIVYEPTRQDADPDASGVQSKAPAIYNNDAEQVDDVEATYALGEDAPKGAEIDEETGVVTLPELPEEGATTVPVSISFGDGSTAGTEAVFAAEDYIGENEVSLADAASRVIDALGGEKAIGFGIEHLNEALTEAGIEEPTFRDVLNALAEAVDNEEAAAALKDLAGAESDPTLSEVLAALEGIDIEPVADDDKDKNEDKDAVDSFGSPVYETVMHDQDKDAEGIQSGKPVFVDEEGEEAKTPGDVKFALGDDAPEGATIDEETGVVTVPEDALEGVTLNVPVVVTSGEDEGYEAKASVRFSASLTGEAADGFAVRYPIVDVDNDDEAEGIQSATPVFLEGEDEQPVAPSDEPEATYALGEDAPEGSSVDEETGVVTLPEEALEAGEDVEVPVVVTFADGSQLTTKVTFSANQGEKTEDEEESEKGEESGKDAKPEKGEGSEEGAAGGATNGGGKSGSAAGGPIADAQAPVQATQGARGQQPAGLANTGVNSALSALGLGVAAALVGLGAVAAARLRW
ncbi:Rib/alpha-like domain-containing protein [Corynebacterium otitidis]